MSHQIKMKMQMKCEHKNELITALQETYPKAVIVEDTNLNVYGGQKVDIAVQQPGKHDFGFVKSDDGESYEYRGYNPGYNDRERVRKNMTEVYDKYYPKVIRKMLAPSGRNYVFGKLKKKDGKTKLVITTDEGSYV